MKQANTTSPILVTGAAGFVGSEIARRCQEAGLTVRLTDRMERNLPHYFKANILDIDSLLPALDGVQSVVHAAGLAHQFNRSRNEVASFTAINVQGTANVVRAAAQAGVSHFLLISSVSVYGPHATGICTENTPCQPQGAYAQSKYQAEKMAIEIAEKSGMALTVLRLATVYGEGDPGNVGRLIRAVDKGYFIWIGSGSNQKSLIHRDDVGRACLTVLQTPWTGIDLYNLSAPPCTMRSIVEESASTLRKRVPPWSVPAPLAVGLTHLFKFATQGRGRFAHLHTTIQKWLTDDVYDTSKFQATFNFQTQISLCEGLRREVNWYQHQVRP